MTRTPFFPPLLFPIVGIFLAAFVAGCAMFGDKAGQPDAIQEFHVHTVEWPGETLPMIAQWYTGSKDNGKIVAKANPNIAPERLAVGDLILIPLELVKNNKKMTKEFVSSFNAKSCTEQKKPSAKTKQAPEKKEDLQPYGPK